MLADLKFQNQLRKIYYTPEGDDYEQSIRPKWSDGTPAHSQYITHAIEDWDAGWGAPIQTVRKIAWKAGLREILALYQKRATTKEEFEDMGVSWWAPWFNEEGSLGTSYAYQLAKEIDFPEGRFNQVDRVLWLLKNKPHDRRIITNMLNLEELKDMTLPPCAFMTMWSVSGEKLNLMLIQRSGDVIPAAGFGGVNTIQYFFLLLMFAQVSGLKPGKFTHVVNNLHIYDKHLDIAKTLLYTPPISDTSSIEFWINSEITNFYDFTENDIKLLNYKWVEDIKNIPIAE